jgi:NitT/TauT family transport system substrate-binding protein
LKAKDAVTGKPITDFKRVAGVGAGRAAGAPLRHAEGAFAEVRQAGKGRQEGARPCMRMTATAASNCWPRRLVRQAKGELSAFLLKDAADAWAKKNGGKVLDFARGASRRAVKP